MIPAHVDDALARGREARDAALREPAHDTRTAAILGIALGVAFLITFVTGLISHLVQNPTSWFVWPARPAGLYRITQGVHVAAGLASVPLLLAKLWSVFPHLFTWPPVRSVAHAIERLMLVPLVCGSVFMLFSGVANVAQWYPWNFPFPTAHYWIGWITIGALVAHIGAKVTLTRDAVRKGGAASTTNATSSPSATSSPGMSRRTYLGLAAGAAGFVTLTTVGQTVAPLRRLALFAPRRPDIGPQGFPVNKRATEEIRLAGADPAYRLDVLGDVTTPLRLSLDDLRGLPLRAATLPIACVEGWSADAHWRGVPVRDLLRMAGVDDDTEVEVVLRSLQRGGSYGRSTLNNGQARDRDTLVALEVNDEVLHPDHGFPCRLIAPNRPGVQQTKWLRSLTVTRL